MPDLSSLIGGLLELLPVPLVGLAYAKRASTLAARGTPVPAGRRISFAAGLTLILIALFSPIARLADDLVFMHMIEHLLIGDLAALLLVIGLTGPLLQPILQIRGLHWLRAISAPWVAFPLWAADLVFWHLPFLYNGVLEYPPLHALQHACFLAFGMVMWMPVFGPLPKPSWWRNAAPLAYVVIVRLFSTAFGNVLIWSGTAFYGGYAAGEAAHGISPLTDQGLAGAIMMGEGMLVTLGVIVWLFLRAAREVDERQRLLDLAYATGFPLDEQRAARAVAAGQGARLEERIRAHAH
jgi:cytochrome c oxidase assembly factor CtaG